MSHISHVAFSSASDNGATPAPPPVMLPNDMTLPGEAATPLISFSDPDAETEAAILAAEGK